MADWKLEAIFASYHDKPTKWKDVLLDRRNIPPDRNMDYLEKRAEKNVERVPWVSSCERRDDWSYVVVMFWEILDFPFKDPDMATKIIDLSFRVLSDYQMWWWKWEFYAHESYMSRWENVASMLLQVRDSYVTSFDSVLAAPFEIWLAFWNKWTRDNKLVENYAKFLNSIKWHYFNESSYAKLKWWWNKWWQKKIERLVPDWKWGLMVQAVPPKPETKTPPTPQLPQPKPGQIRVAFAD